MEERLQHQPTALEPQRAHTNRVRSSPQGGAKLEQTLLMIEGKLGSRSSFAQGAVSGTCLVRCCRRRAHGRCLICFHAAARSTFGLITNLESWTCGRCDVLWSTNVA